MSSACSKTTVSPSSQPPGVNCSTPTPRQPQPDRRQEMGINTFREVVDILDAAVNGPGTEVGPPHHAFWRNITRDEFVHTKVLGQPIVVLGDGAHSNLILSLKGEPPFGSGPD